MGPLPPGTGAELPLPELPPVTGEAWLTVRAVLAAAERWAPAGHEVAWGQIAVPGGHRAAPRSPPVPVAASPHGDITLGEAVFDRATGVLRRLGGLELVGPRLDLWRAPTDNDEGYHGPEQLAKLWRAAGLDRLRHRTVELVAGAGLRVRTRVAPAAADRGFTAVYTWTLEDGALTLRLELVPEGELGRPAAPRSASASPSPPGCGTSSGSAAARARRTPTRGWPRGSAASPARSRSCRRRT